MLSYLELLKLSLTDLVSERSVRAYYPPAGGPMEMHLIQGGGELVERREGRDWPLTALTMVGTDRLDSLQAMVERVCADGVPGDLIETGVWRGGASLLMRATLDVLGEVGRRVVLADTFEGFSAELDGEWWMRFDILVAHLEDVRASFDRLGLADGVEFVQGRVEVTLPALRGRQWAVIRLDTDTYDAITAGLECLYPDLSSGGFVIVDDYQIIEPVRRATEDFRRRIDCPMELEILDWNCARWRKP